MHCTTLWNANRKALGRLHLLLLFTSLAVASRAQTTQQFTGHVLDSTGAAIPKADVVVQNQGTGVENKTTSTSVGVFTVPYLDPGTYTISVSKSGFRTEKETDIKLDIDQTSTIDFALAVGASSEVVTVTANQTQIELSKADRGEVIDSERVAELPLDSRNPYLLYKLAAGTHDFSSPIYPRPFDDVTDNFVSAM